MLLRGNLTVNALYLRCMTLSAFKGIELYCSLTEDIQGHLNACFDDDI